MKFYRGDTKKYSFQILDAEGEVITAVPDSLCLTVRRHPDCREAIIQKKLGNGIETDGEGKWSVTFLPEDTAGLAPGKYGFDREVRFGGAVKTQTGTLEILADYTRSEDE